LQCGLSGFITVISDPSLANDTRKEDTLKVADIMEKTRLHLDTKLDILMRLFEVSDPYFYKTYKDARALDTNGSMQTPTAIIQLEANISKTIYVANKYVPDTLFTLQNTSSSNDIYISLSTTDNVEGSITIAIPSGETRQRIASNLANDGLYLIGSNKGSQAGELKIWVE
jgi:hypothetical protein